MIERCPICDANLAMVGRSHRCIPKNEVDNRSAVRKADKSPPRTTVARDAAPKLANDDAGTVVTIKRGRPRIGEKRAKPWLDCDPPMSKTTWWRRRQAEKREAGK